MFCQCKLYQKLLALQTSFYHLVFSEWRRLSTTSKFYLIFYFLSKFARKFLTVPGAAFIEALDWYLPDLLILSVSGSPARTWRTSFSSVSSPTTENFVSKFFTVPAAAFVFDLWSCLVLVMVVSSSSSSSTLSLLSRPAREPPCLEELKLALVSSSLSVSTNSCSNQLSCLHCCFILNFPAGKVFSSSMTHSLTMSPSSEVNLLSPLPKNIKYNFI